MKNTKDNKKDKKVLIGALGIAAVIAAGSTFAWFTSSDEVTNRLTASADYGVSITETFTPPNNDWLPGQTIKKEVSAVNTGNVDAFVRMDLTHVISGKVLDPAGVAIAATIPENAVKIDTNKANWRETYQTGELVVIKGEAAAKTDATDLGYEFKDGAVLVDSHVFTPTDDGLYIFRRQIDGTTYSFSGYYKKGTDYYKLNNAVLANGDFTVDILNLQNVANSVPTAEQIAAVKLAASKNLPAITEDNTTAVYDSANNKIVLTYGGADGDTTSTDDNIIININLAENFADNWTYLNDFAGDSKTTNGHFYLNKILAAGATSDKLVASVTLDGAVKNQAFTELTYDLTVGLDSVQISPDEEKTAASYVVGVNSAWAPAEAAKSGDAITWTKQ